jgi:hypothetical protein
MIFPIVCFENRCPESLWCSLMDYKDHVTGFEDIHHHRLLRKPLPRKPVVFPDELQITVTEFTDGVCFDNYCPEYLCSRKHFIIHASEDKSKVRKILQKCLHSKSSDWAFNINPKDRGFNNQDNKVRIQ